MTADDESSKLLDGRVQSMPVESARNLASKIRIMVVEDDASTQIIYEKGLFNEVFEKNGCFGQRRPAYI